MTGTTTRSDDELADSIRADLADLHARIDASTHPKKQRLQRKATVMHGAAQDIGEILNDCTGSGLIAARAGDDKD